MGVLIGWVCLLLLLFLVCWGMLGCDGMGDGWAGGYVEFESRKVKSSQVKQSSQVKAGQLIQKMDARVFLRFFDSRTLE